MTRKRMTRTRMIIISLSRTKTMINTNRCAIFVPICNAVPSFGVQTRQKPAFTVLHENCTRARRAKRLAEIEARKRCRGRREEEEESEEGAVVKKKKGKISEQFSNSVIKSAAYEWSCYRLNGELRRGSVDSNNTVHRHHFSYPVAFPNKKKRTTQLRLCRSFPTRSPVARVFTASHKSATKFRCCARSRISRTSISTSWKRHFTTAGPICFPALFAS